MSVDVSRAIGEISVIVEDRSIVGLAMSVGTETEDIERSLEVSFRSIGELCRDVIAEAELRAARQATAANGKEAGAETPASLTGEEPRQTSRENQVAGFTDGHRTVPVLRLVISNRGEPTHAANEGVYPTRRVGSPLVLVAGGRHSDTATLTVSLTADARR